MTGRPPRAAGDGEPVTLDLGDRTRPSDGDGRPPARRPDARAVRRALAALAAGVLVLTTAAPQPRAVPSAGDLRVALRAGPLERASLDTLTVTADVLNDAPFPVTVRAARLSRDLQAGVLPFPVTVPAAGAAELALPARPDCADRGTDTLDLTLVAAGGTRRVRVPVRTDDAYAGLCPATLDGLHAVVTGARLDASGTGVQARVVNHGTLPLAVGLPGVDLQRRSRSVIESGSGLTVAERGGAPPTPPAAVVAFPALPVLLAPGGAVVLTLRPLADPCRAEPAGMSLHQRAVRRLGDQSRSGRRRVVASSVPVEQQESLGRELLLAADRACRQRTG